MRNWGRIVLFILREATVWWREIAGWLLVALGLYLMFITFVLISDNLVLEAGPLGIIGVVVFRGGIHLLKVAVAARLCSQARETVAIAAKTPPGGPARR
jgi:hypothetical protein